MSAALATIEPDALDRVTGGNWLTTGLKGAAKVGSKFIPIAGYAADAYGAYQGYNAYSEARKGGASVPSSLLKGAGAFLWG